MDEHTQLQVFGKNIRRIRRDLGLSQEELAERCGIHRTYIGGVERGERNVAFLNILRIARALQVSPCQLFEEME